MKKNIGVVGVLAIILLTGCSADSITETYTKTTDEDGLKLEQKVIIHGSDDYLDKTEETWIYTFENPGDSQSAIDEMKKEFIDYKTCPAGNVVGDIVTNCSEYITFDWNENNNILEVSEVTDFKTARKEEKQVYYNEVVLKNEYYSFSKVRDQYKEDGLTLQEE